MKKLILIIACIACTMTAGAQRARSTTSSFFSTERSDAPIRFGITAGVNFANMSYDVNGVSVSPDSRTGFNVGLTVDIPLIESIYIKTGLGYTVKGSKLEVGNYEEKSSPAYLELPILASYRYDFSDAAQLQFNVGPYLAYGIGGKVKVTDGSDEDEEDFFGDDSDTKRFDAGLHIGAGITVAQHYYLGVAYQWGWVNINEDSDLTVKNKNFMINLGYIF